MGRPKKPGPQPKWPKIGDKVNYHSVIDEPATKFGLTVRTEPQLLGGHTWVVWLEGFSSCVGVDAISKAEKTDDNQAVQVRDPDKKSPVKRTGNGKSGARAGKK